MGLAGTARRGSLVVRAGAGIEAESGRWAGLRPCGCWGGLSSPAPVQSPGGCGRDHGAGRAAALAGGQWRQHEAWAGSCGREALLGAPAPAGSWLLTSWSPPVPPLVTTGHAAAGGFTLALAQDAPAELWPFHPDTEAALLAGWQRGRKVAWVLKMDEVMEPGLVQEIHATLSGIRQELGSSAYMSDILALPIC